jgi:exodeoxyribonuclease V gamma subunit
MLARLQRDLLLDQPPEPGIGEADASIQVHAVTTPHRAAEVAHEAVLAAMSDMPGLRPERVAILTPDIVSAGNAIESVFTQHGQLPLTAADKQLARASSLAVAMRHVIAAVSDGLTMACLQAVLGQPSVLAKLRLRSEGLARWLDRLEQAGARRFLDQFDRAPRLERDRVADDRIHTLQWAVDRVVLGLAMQTAVDPLDMAEHAEPLACVDMDLLPAPASGSAGLEELHQVVRAIEALADFVRAASTARPLARLLSNTDTAVSRFPHCA